MSTGKITESWRTRLRERRIALGLSQAELGRLIGRSQSRIADYESATFEPSTETWIKLAKALRTTPEWLAFGRRSRGRPRSAARAPEAPSA